MCAHSAVVLSHVVLRATTTMRITHHIVGASRLSGIIARVCKDVGMEAGEMPFSLADSLHHINTHTQTTRVSILFSAKWLGYMCSPPRSHAKCICRKKKEENYIVLSDKLPKTLC